MKSYRWFWLLLFVPLILGVGRLRFDAEILNLLPEKLAVAQGLQVHQKHFSNSRELVITLQAPTAEEAESAARSLAQRLRGHTGLVAEVTWQPPWMEHPEQAAELMAFLWLNQSPADFGELTNRLAPVNLARTLQEAREQLATSFSPTEVARRGNDPCGLMRLPPSVAGEAPVIGGGEELFAAGDGAFRLLFVEAKPGLVGYRACRAWLADIQRIITVARDSGLLAHSELHFTGRPVFVTEIAGAMEKDMAGSASSTLAIIGILFWLTHRRLRPLAWLLFLLLLILAGTAALGGLLFGTINVVSLGFAAILLGLAEDFGIVIYQESRSHPELKAAELRREVAPGIFWSAVTTAGAFLTLNLSALPGLGQLGSLVAIGVLLAAAVMLYVYLPPLLRWRRERDATNHPGAEPDKFLLFTARKVLPPRAAWFITGALLAGSAGVVWKTGPPFDQTNNPLKPKHSEASATMEQIRDRFGRKQEPWWIMVSGRNESEVHQRLAVAAAGLNQAVSNRLISGFTLPSVLFPQSEHQQANRLATAALLAQRDTLRTAALTAGFTTNSLSLTEAMFDHWQRASASSGVFWPSNHASRWMLGKVAARHDHGFLALGLIHPATNAAIAKPLASVWPDDWQRQGIILSGWELLGTTVFDLVMRELPRVLTPIILLVLVSLWLAFRNVREVALSLAALAFSGLGLWAAMGWLQWEWNLLNLMALPLLLGMGVDFSIHIQMALRRCRGDRLAVRRSVGRALLLAGATTIAGFGSLAFSTNAGMASLGKVCALGILLALLTAVYLLPVWWAAVNQGAEPA